MIHPYLWPVLIEVIAATAICLLLLRIGFTYLTIFLGVLVFVIAVLLPPAGLSAPPYHLSAHSSAALTTGLLFGALLVFVSRGADEARRLIAGLFFGTAAPAALIWLLSLGGGPALAGPVALLRLLALTVVTTLAVYLYSRLHQHLSREPSVALALGVLLVASGFDALLLMLGQAAAGMLGAPAAAGGRPAAWPLIIVRAGAAVWCSAALALVLRYRLLPADELPSGRDFSLLDFITYRQQYEIARNIALSDELTGLGNRRHFNSVFPREVERAKRYNQPLSLAFIDIDHFKRVNDRWGHDAGDKILAEVAQVLLKNSRDIDSLFRYGGEEFVVLLPSTSTAGAVAAMNKLRERIRALDLRGFGPQMGSITVSVGIATCPAEATDGRELIALADRRLYAAKAAGRNRVVEA